MYSERGGRVRGTGFVGSLVRWFVGSSVRWFVGSLVGWFKPTSTCVGAVSRPRTLRPLGSAPGDASYRSPDPKPETACFQTSKLDAGQVVQQLHQVFQRAAAVADAVLFGGREFGGGGAHVAVVEHRIVAEAAFAT